MPADWWICTIGKNNLGNANRSLWFQDGLLVLRKANNDQEWSLPDRFFIKTFEGKEAQTAEIVFRDHAPLSASAVQKMVSFFGMMMTPQSSCWPGASIWIGPAVGYNRCLLRYRGF
jgi:hypothetical protein